MADAAIILTIVLAVVGAILSAGLVVIFYLSYRRVRAPFTLSLIMVAAFFLAQNLLSLYMEITMMSSISEGLTPYMLGIMAFGDIALGVLFWTSRK